MIGEKVAANRAGAAQSARGSAVSVLPVFLKLGVSAFGGPVAHLAYFREEFVVRRAWLDERAYLDLVALCQFLPGPTSSQVGFSIGLLRAGYWGAAAAWTGFTLPSAIALVLFAFGAGAINGVLGLGLLHGLQLAAVSVVAQAVWGMARSLCPDLQRAAIASAAALLMLLDRSAFSQVLTILLGGILGFWLCQKPSASPAASLAVPVSRSVGIAALVVFMLLLIGLPLLRHLGVAQGLAAFEAFYHAGALVFGGGHVVLPLLRDEFVSSGWVGEQSFLVGYGAAQAIPGPLFTFAAYLGTVMQPSPHGVAGAVLGLIGIFLPGLLIVLGTLPFWAQLRNRAWAQAALRGINAAVVGLLAAALYNPVWTGAVRTVGDIGVALLGFLLLNRWRVPPLWVVMTGALGGVALALTQ